ncbi:PDZ domain-containing protein [Kiritimatiellaeota bacterium B1221]|nr:PDZ domain-containing protein [Kiritimatiellaeota bacterium B1221]
MKNMIRSLPVLLAVCIFPVLEAAELRGHPPGMLGVGLDEITATEVSKFQLPGEYGAWVVQVGNKGPADSAGIQMNDVIISYNGQRVESARALSRMVQETPANREVEIKLIRNGSGVLVQPVLGKGRVITASTPRPPQSLGVGIENISPAVGEYLGLNEGVGVIVRAIKENSPASEAGLLEKDILVKIDETDITSAQQLADVIKSLNSYRASLTVIRGTETLSIEVQF